VLLLALTVIGGAVFAQATVNGYVRAKAEYTDVGVTYADRLRMNFSAVTEDKNAFFYGRFQASTVPGAATLADGDDKWDGATDLIYYAYGGVKLAGGMVKLSGGYINNYDYTIGSSGDDWYNGGISNNGYSYEHAKMVLAQLYPVAGLNVGVAVKPSGAEFNLSDVDLSVKYDATGLGTVVVDADFGADADMALTRYSATAKFTGVPNLSAAVGYTHSAADVAGVFGIVGYTAGALYAEVSPQFDLDASALYLEVWAKYTVSKDLAVAGFAQYRSDPTAAQDGVFGGATVYVGVSGKGWVQTGLSYGDVAGVKIPVVVKVTF